jgi:hypothetical protein
MEEWWHVIEFSNGETSPGAWDLRPLAERIPWPDVAGKRCLDVGTADVRAGTPRRPRPTPRRRSRHARDRGSPLSLLPAPLARLDARQDGREWFVFNPRGMRKVVELAGWTVEAQTGILAEHVIPAAGNWKWRTGVRGRSCALRARRTE